MRPLENKCDDGYCYATDDARHSGDDALLALCRPTAEEKVYLAQTVTTMLNGAIVERLEEEVPAALRERARAQLLKAIIEL